MTVWGPYNYRLVTARGADGTVMPGSSTVDAWYVYLSSSDGDNVITEEMGPFDDEHDAEMAGQRARLIAEAA